MKFKLLLKQSFKDFKKNILVMLSFALFLIIIFSMVVGMLSFSTKLQSDIKNLTKNSPNAYLSVFKYGIEEENNNSEVILKTDENSKFYEYCKNLVEGYENSSYSTYSNDEILNIFIKYSGQEEGTIKIIDSNENSEIKEYNDIVNYLLKNKIDSFFYSKNIIVNYYIENLLSNNDIDFNFVSGISYSKNRVTFDYMRTSNNIDSNLTTNTPTFFQKNKRGFEYQNVLKRYQLNSHQQQLYDSGRVILTTEKNIKTQNYKIGQSLYLDVEEKNVKTTGTSSEEVLLLGSAIDIDNYNTSVNDINTYSKYYLPYNLLQEKGIYSDGIYTAFSSSTNKMGIVFQIKNKSINDAQSFIENNELTTNSFSKKGNVEYITYNGCLVNESWIYLATKSIPQSAVIYEDVSILFGVLLIILLGIVFYFITIQIISSQRKMLYFLKAMGENNFKLSALTTMSLIPIVLISLVVSLFVSLFVQNMMNITISSAFSISTEYWNFSVEYFIYNLIILIISLIVFFVINFLILRGKTLTNKGVNAVKAPKMLQIKFKKYFLSKTPSRFNIGVSFAIKNLWKNIVSLLVLSICFGVILISVQFNSSISKTSHLFEKWNEPYKSLVSNENLQSFRFEKEDNQYTYTLKENYEQIEDDSGLNGIDSILEKDNLYGISLEGIIQKIISGEIMDPSLNEFYLTKKLTVELLSPEGKDKYDKLMDEYGYAISNKTKEEIDSAYNLMSQAYSLLSSTFTSNFDGFNLYFGKMIINSDVEKDNPSFLSMSGVARKDSDNYEYISSGTSFRINAASSQSEYLMSHFELSKTNNIIESNIADSNGIFNTIHVNISKAFSSNFRVGKNSTFLVEQKISGVKITLKVKVDNILQDNTISNEIYINKDDYFKYLYSETLKESEQIQKRAQDYVLKHTGIWTDEQIEEYYSYIKKMDELNNLVPAYKQIVDEINDGTHPYYYLDNSMYSSSTIPYLLENLTLPYYSNGGEQPSDYDNNLTKTAFNAYEDSVYIFDTISKMLESLADPVKELMSKFIIILIALTISISIILTMLVLFENRTIIILMKSMGYRTRQVISYLSVGYILASIFAAIVGGVISYYGLSFLSSALFLTLKTTLIFSWSSEYFLVEIFSALWFIGIIIGSISIYTTKQKPKQAFSTL